MAKKRGLELSKKSNLIKIQPVIILILLLLNPTFANNSNELLEKINSTVDSEIKVDYYVDLAQTFLNEPDKAMPHVMRAIQLAKKLNYTTGEADLYNTLGVLHWHKQNFKQSIEYYQKSLELRKPGEDDKAISNNHANIGVALLMIGNYVVASEHLLKSYKIRKQLGNEKAAAEVSINLGFNYYYMGQFSEATTYLLNAADYFEKVDDQENISACYNNIGGIYIEIEDFDKAEEYFRKSYSIDKTLGNEASMSPSLGNLANIDLKKGRYEEAVKKYEEVIVIEKKLKNISNTAEAYNGLGNAYKELKNYNKAIEYLKKALELKENSENEGSQIVTLISLAELNFEMGKTSNESKNDYLDATILFAEKALKVLSDNDSILSKNKAYYQLYLAHKEKNQFEKSLQYHEQYEKSHNALVNSEKQKQIVELETKFQVTTKNREIVALQAKQEIQDLQIQEQKARMQAQRQLIIIGITLSLLAILILVIFGQRYQHKQQKIKSELTIHNLRTEQKVMRSQMNPHFIYNSLNAIQAFISSNESYLAEKYLSKFARLMRGILENSMHEYVPFEKEFEVLQSYLELEQVRFENRFKFSIILNEDFEDEFITIPPMLIQPFLENAILHGFKDIDNGILNIHFKEKNQQIICTIEDNGIGRKKAAEYKSKISKTSLATQITNRRLEVLSNHTGIDSSLEIIDKRDESTKKATGTIVIIKIPVIEN